MNAYEDIWNHKLLSMYQITSKVGILYILWEFCFINLILAR